MKNNNKKRARLAFAELEAEMEILQKEDLKDYKGGSPKYQYDCFWRSLVYLKFGQLNDDAAVNQLAEYFARDFFMYHNNWTCDQADQYLKQHGSGVTFKEMLDFLKYSAKKGDTPFSGGFSNYMGYFNSNDLPNGYDYTGFGHVVILKERHPDGSATIIDPQNNYNQTEITKDEADKLRYISY